MKAIVRVPDYILSALLTRSAKTSISLARDPAV